jgi:protection of telomeres protein 1
MAVPGLPHVPPGFTDLQSAWTSPLLKTNDKKQWHLIAVCIDYLEPAKTRGTDYTMKMTLHDPYFVEGIGLKMQPFFKSLEEAPKVQNQGDVIIFRNAVTYEHPSFGKIAMWSWNTTWAVLEYESLSNSTAEDCSDVVVHRCNTRGRQAPMPSVEEIKYAKAILDLETPSQWPAPAPRTALSVNTTIVASGGVPQPLPTKHRVISQLVIPENNRCYVDLTVEVRRMYETDIRVELAVTDWSENANLYNYIYDKSDPDRVYDFGDQYGYASNSHKGWPAPWGKRSMTIVLWSPHREYAISKIKTGAVIQLRNVHIKLDKNGGKIEGILHGDNIHPDRIMVSVVQNPATESESNETIKELLRRKRDHEEFCKRHDLPFVRDAQPSKLQQWHDKRKYLNNSKPGQDEGANDSPDEVKSRNRKKKEKQRARAAAQRAGKRTDTFKGDDMATSSVAPNAHVRTDAISAALVRVSEILSLKLLARTTPEGQCWIAPFQNCKYKSKVRVVGFLPHRVEDFAVRVRMNQYGALSDGGSAVSDASSEGSDVEMTDADKDDGTDGEHDADTRWEWRFALVIEDANPKPLAAKNQTSSMNGHEQQRLVLVVSGMDADYLLRDEACNLRKHAKKFALLKERLFVLWGDLLEKFEESQADNAETPVVDNGSRSGGYAGENIKASSQPFECFISEYGVKRDAQSDGSQVEHWERCFKMVQTSIA